MSQKYFGGYTHYMTEKCAKTFTEDVLAHNFVLHASFMLTENLH